MLQNYVTVALRNLAKHKLYSFINIAGLAVALASALLIMLFVRDELSFDKQMPDHERLYRAEATFAPPGRDPLRMGSTMFPLAGVLKSEIAGVEDATRIGQQSSAVKYGDKLFFEEVHPADPNFFQLLRFPLLKGDPATVLARPNTLVISERIAKKYFGDEDPVGKTVTLDEKFPLEVTGVMADVPANSHLDIDILLPIGSDADRYYAHGGADNPGAQSWTSINHNTYFRVAPGTSIAAVEAQFPAMVRRHVDPAAIGLPTGSDAWDLLKISAMPYGRIHFSPNGALAVASRPPGDWATVYGFTMIAALILLIAAINFMNLATARATQRAREVAMRKVVGARRRQLVIQFLGESVLIALCALVLALALVELLLPAFASFVDRPITLSYLGDWDVMLGIVLAAVVTGLLGGLYPALILSGFRPATVLKSNRSGQGGSGGLRAALVIVQFAISIGLGIVASVVYGQTLYARSYDLGLHKENRLILTGIGRDQVTPLLDTMRTQLLAIPGVTGVAGSDIEPFSGNENNTIMRQPEHPDEAILVRQLVVEPEFFDAYGMKIVAGRPLSRERGEDRSPAAKFGDDEPDNLSIVINEAAARRLGYTPAEAIGKVLREDISVGTNEGERLRTRVIVGVVQDAHFDSLRQPVFPTRYIYNPHFLNHYVVATDGRDTPAVVEQVRQVWDRLVPALPARLGFVDQNYDALYAQDALRGQMFGLFSGLAVLIACLGLFGLAAFTAERRTKEIGVRKVFGANVGNIVALLLWQFSKPVLIANLIAWPVAWYYLTGWLDGFAYRIDLSPLYFIAAGLGALVIAWLTVTMHSLRVARAKPVLALRYE
ncbi:MAG: ABC transporter permease [Alphaproteobacteria bacterium]|nr:ABC transporter permease [Alphaproteobacteria bacterium]